MPPKPAAFWYTRLSFIIDVPKNPQFILERKRETYVTKPSNGLDRVDWRARRDPLRPIARDRQFGLWSGHMEITQHEPYRPARS